ncbi:MAG: exodeoxyribonuclease VII small subunit [Zoogloea sp.]|nr:exodeoxyribonuclease VII small subunit [Zoogloea sp.]
MARQSSSKLPSFESAISELETIVQAMETGDLPLEEALERYQRGIALLRHCQGTLDGAERKIRIIEAETDKDATQGDENHAPDQP